MKSKKDPYRRIYPSDVESIVFDGGMNNKFDKALIEDNESPDCANVVFYNGSVASRDGALRLNTTPVAAAAFDGLYTRRANDSSETMCAFINGTMYTLNATTFITVPSAQGFFTTGNNVVTEFAENYMFIGNGTNVPHKWDGTYFTQHGVPAPTTTATVVSNGVGALSASAGYVYKYTYVNSALVESNLGPPSTTFVISATSGQNNLSNIAVAPTSAGVARRRIYRTLANGTSFFKVADLLDNTTTTYSDNTPDLSLGAAAPTDNAVPPNYSAIIYIRNILFCNDPANPNFVRYSVAGQPYTFPALNFFKVGDNASDLVKGFAAYDNNLVIFCEKSVWINYMADPATPSGWRQLRTNSPYGSRSPLCALPYLNKVLFPSLQGPKFVGFAALAGLALDPTNTIQAVTATGSDLQSDRIETDMFSVNETYLTNIAGIVYKTRAYITLTYGSSATKNNRCYLFDFSMSNLRKDQKVSWVPITGWNAKMFAIYGGKLYFASSDTSGLVFQIDGTGVYSDDGTAINAYYWTKEYPGFLQETNFTKDFRYANVLVDTEGNYYMNVSFRTDSDSGIGNTFQINLGAQTGAMWGSMIWGVDSWGGGVSQIEPRVYLGQSRGTRIQFKFTNQNTAGQRFKVQRMNFVYNLKGYR